MEKFAPDIAGQKFGKLTAIEFVEYRRNFASYWLFKCDCGGMTVTRRTAVINQTTTSCGCARRDCQLKHGHCAPSFGSRNPSRTYATWQSMRNRCNSPDHKSFKDYGAKGISVDPSWETFENFLRDVGERPPHTTLDRIDGSKGYFKENVRWVSVNAQAYNRRKSTLKLTSRYKGVCTQKGYRGWFAFIKQHGVQKRLGHFYSEKEAARAYDKAAKEQFGEFAVLNNV